MSSRKVISCLLIVRAGVLWLIRLLFDLLVRRTAAKFTVQFALNVTLFFLPLRVRVFNSGVFLISFCFRFITDKLDFIATVWRNISRHPPTTIMYTGVTDTVFFCKIFNHTLLLHRAFTGFHLSAISPFIRLTWHLRDIIYYSLLSTPLRVRRNRFNYIFILPFDSTIRVNYVNPVIFIYIYMSIVQYRVTRLYSNRIAIKI